MATGFVITFVLLAAAAIVGAWKMIFSHHPVHSALYLVLSFCATAGIYLLLGAPFIAVVQVAVYAGAIMVLFLFIIMHLDLGLARDVADDHGRRTAAAVTAGMVAVLLIAGGAVSWSGMVAGLSEASLRQARKSVAEGKQSAPGLPAGHPETVRLMRAARASSPPPSARVEDIGVELFSGYALPFEVASLLLLVAMIGVIVLARPELHRAREHPEESPAS